MTVESISLGRKSPRREQGTEPNYMFTSESVTEGHPDKVCDTIADAILDAYFVQDVGTRINIEALAKANHLVLSGEITSNAVVDHEAIARQTIRDIGYVGFGSKFDADSLHVHQFITRQATEIDQGVSANRNTDGVQGAGDQGMMFGYATNETPELMPLAILLSHRLTRQLSEDRRSGDYPWMRPDGKAQVTVEYEGALPIGVSHVVVSLQHDTTVDSKEIHQYVTETLAPKALGHWFNPKIIFHVNPTGSFIHGGPDVDSGLTGRKIIVDTYGGAANHGGGSFSGKDPSKVDRSGAYYSRFVACEIVKRGLAERVEIQVAYAIGEAKPVSIRVNTFATGDVRGVQEFVDEFDFRPNAMIERLGLLSPIYGATTNYGHFGKSDLPWEK